MRLILLTVCAIVPGAPGPRPMPSLHQRNAYLQAEFQRLDGNRDGKVSQAEYTRNSPRAIAQAEKTAKKHGYDERMVSRLYTRNRKAGRFPPFSLIDVNGDGQIEFHREYLTFPSRTFAEFCTRDANGDGKVTRPEYRKSRMREYKAGFVGEEAALYQPPTETHKKRWELEFALRDRDNDGNVTWPELLAHTKLTPNVLAEGTPADAYYVRLDTDFDGVVSREEFLAPARKPGNEQLLPLEKRVFRLRDLNGDGKLTYTEFARTGENAARGFLSHDKDGDGVIRFEDVKGIQWFAGKSTDRDRCYFQRLDANGDGRVTWKEFRSLRPRSSAFAALDHLAIDNRISKKEWNAVKAEYLAGQKGQRLPAQSASSYATQWFPGIFDLITFEDVDANRDGTISWTEFRTFP